MVRALLCVDPDTDTRGTTAQVLRERTGYEIVECADLTTAIDTLDPATDGVVTEFDLPDGTGADLLERVRATAPDASFVLFTDADPDEMDTAMPDEAIAEYVPKSLPTAHEELAVLVSHSVENRTQAAYPLPDDEPERVAALAAYEPVLDELAPSFDRLATIAGDLLDVPMAAIGLVDEHEQSFVACFGVEFGVFPREDTICTYAILEEDVSTIPDLALDPRFEDHEGLAAHDLRAYASANMTTPGGRVVGTFCAYDTVPREWTDSDREHLQLLASEAMELLELRRRLHEITDSESRATVPNGGLAEAQRGEHR